MVMVAIFVALLAQIAGAVEAAACALPLSQTSSPDLLQAPPGVSENQDVQSQDSPPQFKSRLYQLVVVKASTLLPPGLRRQILRHRLETLQGCLEPLRESASPVVDIGTIEEAFAEALAELQGKEHFSRICNRLGRLSSLVNEYASPLNRNEFSAYRDFFSDVLATFPLVISRAGEGYLRQHSLRDYLLYVSQRRDERIELLSRVLEESDPSQWRDQRSLPYGLAVLIYNDMIMDSARVWLYLWQEAGGDIGGAPYFRLEPESAER